MTQVGLDPRTIYNYDTHRNIPWNVVEYEPIREYLDPQRSITQRKVQQGQATYNKYATKRGSFLDQHIKTVKDLPPPSKYDFLSQFDQTLNKKEANKHKIDFKLKKNSYLQQIQRTAKLYKSPAVGQYSVRHSHSKSKVKKHKHDEKRFFYQDSQFLSTAYPGSACYYPHDDIKDIKKDRTTHQLWIQKHGKQHKRDKMRRLKQPDPGTYRPLSASFNSFDKTKVNHTKMLQKEKNKKPAHGFGSSDSKFTYLRPKKAKQQSRPDPCNYNTMIQWKGKGLDCKKNNWVRCLSAGPSRSVYH